MIVAGVSDSGTASMSSSPPSLMPARWGGRWTIPVLRSRDPTKPNFQSFDRAAADADGRFGVGRLGGSTSPTRLQERYLPYHIRPPFSLSLATAPPPVTHS